jgi:hypothetical protein
VIDASREDRQHQAAVDVAEIQKRRTGGAARSTGGDCWCSIVAWKENVPPDAARRAAGHTARFNLGKAKPASQKIVQGAVGASCLIRCGAGRHGPHSHRSR